MAQRTTSFDEWRATGTHPWKFGRPDLVEEASQIDTETIKQFVSDWKLPNVLSPGQLMKVRKPGINLSRTNQTLFRKIKTVLKKRGEGIVCWACGLDQDSCRQLTGNTAKKGLEAHEFWVWDDEHHVRTLTAIHFLCFDCHYLVERDIIWTVIAFPSEISLRRIERFCTVNQCTVAQMLAQVQYARYLAEQRSKVSDWQIDWSLIQVLLSGISL